MSQDDDLVNEALNKLVVHDKATAKLSLLQAIKINPRNYRAWMLLADTVDSPAEKVKYLTQAQKFNPNDEIQAEIQKQRALIPQSMAYILWGKTNRARTILVFLIFTIIPFIWWLLREALPDFRESNAQMTGEWNVVVVGFTNQGTDLRRSDIRLIGDVFSNRFQQEMVGAGEEANLVIQVWGSGEVGKQIPKGTAEERALQAEKLANEMNADMVVYGSILQNDSGYLLQPEFYIRADNYYEADELIGEHRFGLPISIIATRDNFPSQVQLNVELTRRSEVLALVARGLSLYLIHAYDRAYELFTQADQDELWGNPQGREFIYLFQGNAAIRMQQYELAQTAYGQAVLADPEYARGFIGLGNVTYLLSSTSSIESSVSSNIQYLIQATDYYKKALQAENQPISAEIPSKAAFGLGQVYLVEWFLGAESRNQAVEEFNTVLVNYGDGANPRLQELASETHGRLGVMFRQDKDIDKAIDEFQLAQDLSTLPARKGLYWASLAGLYQQQGNGVQAAEANRRAIENYTLAMTLPISNELRAYYYGRIGERYEVLKEDLLAIQAYEKALELTPEGSEESTNYQERLDALSQ